MIKIMAISLFLVVILIGNAAKTMAYEGLAPGRILWIFDGDTFQVSHAAAPQGEAVRARHYDTPEKGDLAECPAEAELAQQATVVAKRLLPRGSTVLLSDFGRDRYGRLLAAVTLPDGRDLAAVMVRAGLAHPYEGGKKASWCLPLQRPRGDDRKAKGRSAPRARKGQAPAASGRRPGPGCPENPQADRWRALRVSGATPPGPGPLALATPGSTTRKRFAAHKRTALNAVSFSGDQAMARVIIDNSKEKFGSHVSIANLAAFSFHGLFSDDINIYAAADIVRRDWPFEVADIEMEYATGICVTFNDGSCLAVGAWAEGEG